MYSYLARTCAVVCVVVALLAAQFDRWGWFLILLFAAFFLWRWAKKSEGEQY